MKYRENKCSRDEFEELIVLAQVPGNESVIKEITKRDWSHKSLERDVDRASTPKFRRRIWSPSLKIAASVAVLIAVSYGLSQWFSAPDPIVYATGNGEVREIVLPDGSEVTLNANSILTWIPSSRQETDRLVELTGEAFFDVIRESSSDSDQDMFRGFQVHTPKMIIHVLGTSFNVSARQENTEVFLQEGSVELLFPEKEDVAERMVPGDKVVMDNQTGSLIRKEAEDLSSSASWVTGILNYHNKSMGEVLQNLSELFGVEITCEDQALLSKPINLGVPYMDWENTKRALEMAIGVEFQKEGDSYVVVQKFYHEIN